METVVIVFGGLAGLIGGALAALLYAVMSDTGSMPAAEHVAALERRVEALERDRSAPAELGDLRDRLRALESQPAPGSPAGPDPIPGLLEKMRALETALAEAGSRIGELARRTDERFAEAAQATAALPDLERRIGEAGRRLAALEAVERRVASLERRIEEQAFDRRTAFAIALSALQNAISRGAPFAAELATAERLVPKPDERLASLRPYAASGIPTAAALRLEVPAVTNAVADALAGAGAQGVFGRLIANAQSAVRVRPTGPAEGAGPDAVLSRIDAALAAGDPGRALKEWRTLPDPARGAAQAWGERLRARAEAEDVMTALTTALAAPSAE